MRQTPECIGSEKRGRDLRRDRLHDVDDDRGGGLFQRRELAREQGCRHVLLLARRETRGFGGVVSFEVAGDLDRDRVPVLDAARQLTVRLETEIEIAGRKIGVDALYARVTRTETGIVLPSFTKATAAATSAPPTA